MKIGLKKKAGAHTGSGKVTGIRHGDSYGDGEEDDSAEVSIRHGSPPPRSSRGAIAPSSTKRSNVHVPGNVARGLKVGQKVRIHIEPA